MSSSLIRCPIHLALWYIEAKSFVNYYFRDITVTNYTTLVNCKFGFNYFFVSCFLFLFFFATFINIVYTLYLYIIRTIGYLCRKRNGLENKQNIRWSLRGVEGNVLDCDIVTRELKLQSRYYVQFRRNSLEERYEFQTLNHQLSAT